MNQKLKTFLPFVLAIVSLLFCLVLFRVLVLSKELKIIVFVVFLAVFSLAIWRFLKDSNVKKKTIEWIMLFVVIGSGVSIGLLDQYILEKNLRENGIHKECIVSEIFYDTEEHLQLICKFTFEGKTYETHTVGIDDYPDLREGDTLNVFFNQNNPNESIISELQEFIFH